MEEVKLNEMKLFDIVKVGEFQRFQKVPGGWVMWMVNKGGIDSVFIPKSSEVGHEYYKVIGPY